MMLLEQPLIERFVAYAIKHGDFEKEDSVYIQNRVLAILNAEGIEYNAALPNNINNNPSPNDITQYWIQQAVNHHIIEDTLYNKEIIEAQILDLITPRPSAINKQFFEAYKAAPNEATDYFYEISKLNHYVKEDAIANNINYEVMTEYGNIEVTINLSKPEKDAKQIALAKEAKSSEYPQCALCIENEGYKGSVLQAARTNHRIIRITLDNEHFGFQYSPYAYFQEHSIVLSEKHEPMKINRQTFINLLAFIDQFPHYFIGSNADIPVVGGSILSHNHYQTGKHTFPMDNAKEIDNFKMERFPSVKASILKWPMSVIRLKDSNKDTLIEAATYVMDCWNHYSDETVQVKAFSDKGERHHTITPIARYRNSLYEVDIVLRDNQTSDEYPGGIFHPHQDVQHIKKENIGLIEVMGTAILPGRLKRELQDVKDYLLDEAITDLGIHQSWADSMKDNYIVTKSNVDEIVDKEVGYKFKRVLEDAGVFKQTVEGQNAFKRFVQKLKND